MSTIIPLFSTPLYQSHLDDIDYNECNREINLSTFQTFGNFLSLSKEKSLIDRLPLLKQKIIKHLNTYLFEMLCFDPFEYYFVDSWFVKIAPGGKSAMHNHTNSLFSGVVYIHIGDDCEGIKFATNNFISNDLNQMRYELTHKKFNFYNSRSWEFFTKKGDIFIFPSGLEHQPLENKTNNFRYSLSFNVLPYNYSCNVMGARSGEYI